jgi:L-cystine uptake protein TcyP (sodium:dicarboxylate symporter family)
MQKTWKWINEFKEFFINFMWLITFPIIWAPILTTFFELNEKQYLEYLKKRKELILKIVPSII